MTTVPLNHTSRGSIWILWRYCQSKSYGLRSLGSATRVVWFLEHKSSRQQSPRYHSVGKSSCGTNKSSREAWRTWSGLLKECIRRQCWTKLWIKGLKNSWCITICTAWSNAYFNKMMTTSGRDKWRKHHQKVKISWNTIYKIESIYYILLKKATPGILNYCILILR